MTSVSFHKIHAKMANMKNSVEQIPGKNCDGGHICTPPKECCKSGCCYSQSILKSPNLPSENVFSPIFLGYWSFWVAVTATVLGILCACSFWRKHNYIRDCCCRSRVSNEHESELESNGSYYVPPQYSRNDGNHQAPPPYTEVTSKPDLYPLVINYNGEPMLKTNSPSTSYFMVQYIQHFFIRPLGSLSATSTNESLNSSFICNAANEMNTMIPPPYSSGGSLENVTAEAHSLPLNSPYNYPRPRQNHPPQVHNSNSFNSPLENLPPQPINIFENNHYSSPKRHDRWLKSKSCFEKIPTNSHETIRIIPMKPSEATTKPDNHRNLPKQSTADSDSHEDDVNNFSDLLNLSICAQNVNTVAVTSQERHNFYCAGNSVTSSDISSLANMGTPDSPPRATSPTAEMRELLGKIQKLPVKCEASTSAATPKRNKPTERKPKSLYVSLHEVRGRAGKGEWRGEGRRFWFSKSAPNTPCEIVPNYPVGKRIFGQKVEVDGRSPLLKDYEESDEEKNVGF